MELVPLIYTVLEVVAILAIVTLILSYVSFRKKLKVGSTELTNQVTTPQVEPQQGSAGQQQQIQTKDELLSKTLVRKIEAKQNFKKKESTKEKSARVKAESQKAKLKKTAHSKRIQIIKDLKPLNNEKQIQKDETRFTTKTNESLKSLDEDIISKYDEQDENGFHVLSVKDRKDKHAK